jgi:riboflavin transporter FmnP
MNTRATALTITFTALTVALNPNFTHLAIPAPYAPFLIYQIWEIPIVAAFLLSGPKVGASIAALNALVLLTLFPGALLMGPFYNLAATLSMLLGIYVANRLTSVSLGDGNAVYASVKYTAKTTAAATALGIVFRAGIMTIINYVALRFPPPVGYYLSEPAVVAYLPLIGLFNATLALYTVPLGLFLARIVAARVKLQNFASLSA